MLFQEVIDRRQESVADRLLFTGRVEQFQQRREHRDAGEECNQHARAGDLAELGDALVVGRQEAEESGRRRHRGQRERDRGALGRIGQRLRQVVVLETLRAVADAELDAEVHPQPDEQDGKGDRQQVQRSHHHQPNRRGDRKPDEEIEEHGEDDLRRMQRHPENDEHDQYGADAVDDGAVLNGCEFLIGDRNRPGQPDPGAILVREMEIGGRLPDRIGRALAGLQRVEIQDRLEFDEGAPVGIGERLVADQFAPGERGVALVQHVLDRLGDLVEGPFGAVELELPALDAGKAGLQRARQPADAGISGHDLDQGGRGGELAGQLADLVHREEQQPVLLEEFTGAERLDGFEVLGVAGELLRQRGARRAGELRRRRLDHGQDGSVPIKGSTELVVALAPIQIGRNQGIDVGVDGEVPGCIEAGGSPEDKSDQDGWEGKARAGLNNRDDKTCQHINSF